MLHGLQQLRAVIDDRLRADLGTRYDQHRAQSAGTDKLTVTFTLRGATPADAIRSRGWRPPRSPSGSLPTPPRSTSPAYRSSSERSNAAAQPCCPLIVAHSGQGALNVVNPAIGASRTIAGVSVPFVDGILLEGGELYAVQNFLNQIAVVRPSPDLMSGTVEKLIRSELFQIPTTVARFGDRLATVNAKFDTGFPPTAGQHEVIIVDR